jgi:hypothetical protein
VNRACRYRHAEAVVAGGQVAPQRSEHIAGADDVVKAGKVLRFSDQDLATRCREPANGSVF